VEKLQFSVEEITARLDAFLVAQLPDLSKNRARELCENGQVFINGKLAKSGESLKPGDTVEVADFLGNVAANPASLDGVLPKDFAVLYEDDHLLVVAKPRKMASTRLRHDDPPTLADCIASCCSKCVQASPDPREAGLVQRLDFYTSGVVIAGKTPEGWQGVRKQLFAERVEKTYLALIEKRPVKKRFSVTLPLAQSRDGKSMTAVRERSEKEPVQLSAITEVTVVGQYELGAKWFTVVRAKGRRVRRHQIRVHLASSGHPLVGDMLYGAESTLNDALPWAHEDEEGFLLHAQDISLQHPVTGKEMRFQCSSDYFRKLSKLF
jgi:23S rRNA pseudouridine1911/1915/1917 synthase